MTDAGSGNSQSAFGGAHCRSFAGVMSEVVTHTKNPSEGALIVGSHRLTTL